MDGAVDIKDKRSSDIESEPTIPSAPQVEEIDSDVSPTSTSMPLSIPSSMKPFTENQLLALHQNKFIPVARQNTDEFLVAVKGLCFADCSLTESLNEYLRARFSLLSSEDCLTRLSKELENEEGKVWTLQEEKVENDGICHDKVKVVSVHRYQVAKFNSSSSISIGKTMRQIREELFEHHSLCSYKAQKLKTKIDVYLGKMCQDVDISRAQIINAIGILFSFQRKLINEEGFVRDSRSWLNSLVKTIFQNDPNFTDRLLLLNHVLHCPPGVGHWAASYVQIPTPMYTPDDDYLSNESLNQMIALLSIFFSPTKGRRELLREYCPPESPKKEAVNNPWVVLDSDGEDEDIHEAFPLRENDHVAILNQFPFEALFRYLLKFEKGIEVYNPANFTTTSFFKLFAFGTQFVNLLKEGLQLFSSPSYRQFAKRLGHIIKHTLEYISDHWQKFLLSHQGHPEEMAILDRIEVEYNNFFLRSAKSIFSSSASSGMWQYLAVVPYRLVREDVLWHAFALYHFIDDGILSNMRKQEDFTRIIQEKVCDNDFLSSFEDTLSGLPDTEVMFLLTTFANMAIARDFTKSYAFITTVVSELTSIGFINELTAGSCAKGCRDLISNIARQHPTIISFLVKKFSSNVSLVENSPSAAIYIGRDLDFTNWLPLDDDFYTLGNWLTQSPLDSNYSLLSRVIFSKLNWTNPDLMPWRRHNDLAVLIVEASAKYAPDTIAGNFLQDSVRHVSNLAAKLRRTPEQVFISWAWEMVSRLRLHRYDRVGSIADIIDIDLDSGHLGEATATKNPLAAYVALQTSQTGHLVDDVLERGIAQLNLVLTSGHYDHVLECLANMTPLFLDQPELLMTSPEFIKIVQQVITMDQTILKMAKDLVISDFPGPVLKEFVNMMANHVKNFDIYRRGNSIAFINLWLNILSEIPGWMGNRNVLYAMEYCCKAALSNRYIGGVEQLKATLKSIDQKLLDTNREGFFSWLSGSKTATSSYSTLMGEFPLMAFFAVETEEEREESVRFWRALVADLSDNHELISLDKSQKRILADNQFPEYASNLNNLPIYKWCQLILDCSAEHAMQVVFAQKFFKYYTVRHNMESARLGRVFFEGVINTHYFGRVMSKFKAIGELYKKLALENDEDAANMRMANTFQAFVLWLEDAFILDEKLHVASLSPRMMPELLSTILDSSMNVDLSLIHSSDFSNVTEYCSKEWKRLHFRAANARSTPIINEHDKEEDNMIAKLSSYDTPAPLPHNKLSATSVIQVCDNWFCDESTFDATVSPYLLSLLSFSKKFDGLRKEYASLMCNINEHVRGLYINEDVELWTKGSCRGVNGPKGQKFECGGAAAICHKFCEAKLQSQIEQKLKVQRDARRALIDNVMHTIEISVISASSVVDECVEYILKMYFRHLSLCPGRGHSPALLHYHRLGVILFYRLCDQLGEETNACPLMRHLLTSSLERLGQAMIADKPEQCQPLLQRVCAVPEYAQFLTAVFTPGCSDVNTFLHMYRTINEMKDVNSTVAFTLLSKMSVDSWTKKSASEGNLKAISRLVSILGDGFKRTGQQVSQERQLLHDLHRQHLMTILRNSGCSHYDEVISLLLVLTDAEALDPSIWFDVVNVHLVNDLGTLSKGTSAKAIATKCREMAESSQQIEPEVVEIIHKMLQKHFSKERRSVGLHGLYCKYRIYTLSLAAYQGILCSSLVCTLRRSDDSDIDQLQPMFDWIFLLFEPWIIPLMEDQRQETAVWIQQFAEAHKILFPWAPGDVESAQIMLEVFTECVRLLGESFPDNTRGVLAHLLRVYCQRFARQSMKDFVLNPVHVEWGLLPWEKFQPSAEDLSRLVAVLDAFIPLCHEFIGKIFYRFPWKSLMVQAEEEVKTLAPFFIHIVVKLSAEPQVRQSGNLMKMISQDIPQDTWKHVPSNVFENLMHWYVMSVDAKVILIEGSHPLDVKILSILRAASQIDDMDVDKEATFVKGKTFMRCMVRLLSSCGSKHKNYIAQHENELEKSIRELVDDLGDMVISCHNAYPKECVDLMKGFLALMNSNSIMPKHALQSIADCWLRMTDLETAMIFLNTLLGQASTIVNCPSMLSDLFEDCLEAYFQDRGDYPEGGNTAASWSYVLPCVQLSKDKEKLTKCLDHAVGEGHCLLLYVSLQFVRKQCMSIADEQTRLVATLLDWFRHLRLDEKSEAKLPVLFHEMIRLCLRQMACGVNEPTVAKMLLDFTDVLAPLLGLNNQSWTILGVLGFSSKYNPPPRAKFLALSMTYFLQSCVLEGPRLKSKAISEAEKSKLKCLNAEKVTDIEKELETMLTKQAYFGLTENIEWVLKVTRDKTTTIEDIDNFLSFLIRDNLYVERYHHQ